MSFQLLVYMYDSLNNGYCNQNKQFHLFLWNVLYLYLSGFFFQRHQRVVCLETQLLFVFIRPIARNESFLVSVITNMQYKPEHSFLWDDAQNGADLDQTPQNAASIQSLHCLLTECFIKIWIKRKVPAHNP